MLGDGRGKHMHNSTWALRSILGVGIILAATQFMSGQKMTGETQFLNPSGLSRPTGYTHVVIAQPGRLVYVSGQVALDSKGEIVGKGDLRAQTTQAMENIKTALAAAGATPQDVVKVNYYVVDLKPDLLPTIREVRGRASAGEHAGGRDGSGARGVPDRNRGGRDGEMM